MSEKFLIETADGMLNIHGVDLIRREKELSLVALKQGQVIHSWEFNSMQDRESALIILRKEFEPLKIQFH
jgi:hypothetical protein